MKIGLFFGSFNPIHIGHLIIANHIRQEALLDEVWFVVSPQNPFKKQGSLLDQYQRLHMVNLAIDDTPGFRASDVEFALSKPSYTSHTLAYLQEKYPTHEFSLIMGEDNLTSLHKWKNVDFLVEQFPILVYPRDSNRDKQVTKNEQLPQAKVAVCQAPIIDISASYIRQMIQDNMHPKFVLPTKVFDYVEEMGFYKK